MYINSFKFFAGCWVCCLQPFLQMALDMIDVNSFLKASVKSSKDQNPSVNCHKNFAVPSSVAGTTWLSLLFVLMPALRQNVSSLSRNSSGGRSLWKPAYLGSCPAILEMGLCRLRGSSRPIHAGGSQVRRHLFLSHRRRNLLTLQRRGVVSCIKCSISSLGTFILFISHRRSIVTHLSRVTRNVCTCNVQQSRWLPFPHRFLPHLLHEVTSW